MRMVGLRRRISNTNEEPTTTDLNGATRKLVELVERASAVGRGQGPLVPVEALVTIERDSWVWQIVDREVLDSLSHRLVFEGANGRRREILMTACITTAMSAASKIVDLDDGCVLIETLDP